jgi:hypothetical protein
MGDDRQPDYDFFVPPRGVTAPPAGPQGEPYPGQSYPDQLHPGQPYPGQPYPGSAAGPYPSMPRGTVIPAQMNWAGQLPPARSSGMPRWLIAVIVVVSLFFGIAILAAVAVPVFLSQRNKAEYQNTTVALPATFNNQSRNTGADAVKVARGFVVEGVVSQNDVAVYGKVGPTMVVIMALKPPSALSSIEQQNLRTDIEKKFAALNSPVVLVGGPDPADNHVWTGCGQTGQGLEVCLATSPGSLVTVMTSAAGAADPMDLVRQAQAATVHHR